MTTTTTKTIKQLEIELDLYKTNVIWGKKYSNYNPVPKAKRLQAIMDLELLIKLENNRLIFQKEFGYYPEGDIITDEELVEMRSLESTIEAEVKESFRLADLKRAGKKTFNKKNNMDFMFR